MVERAAGRDPHRSQRGSRPATGICGAQCPAQRPEPRRQRRHLQAQQRRTGRPLRQGGHAETGLHAQQGRPVAGPGREHPRVCIRRRSGENHHGRAATQGRDRGRSPAPHGRTPWPQADRRDRRTRHGRRAQRAPRRSAWQGAAPPGASGQPPQRHQPTDPQGSRRPSDERAQSARHPAGGVPARRSESLPSILRSLHPRRPRWRVRSQTTPVAELLPVPRSQQGQGRSRNHHRAPEHLQQGQQAPEDRQGWRRLPRPDRRGDGAVRVPQRQPAQAGRDQDLRPVVQRPGGSRQ
ncbi:hypothetical protein D3C76_690830 [compost metagenome]